MTVSFYAPVVPTGLALALILVATTYLAACGEHSDGGRATDADGPHDIALDAPIGEDVTISDEGTDADADDEDPGDAWQDELSDGTDDTLEDIATDVVPDTSGEDSRHIDASDDAMADVSEADLLAAATSFDTMPQTIGDLLSLVGPSVTFSSGAPFNDLEFTAFDTTYMDGENGGFDVFYPVDPSDSYPGADTIRYIRTVLISDLDATYGSARGARVILGTHELGPFFLRGDDDVDDDFVVIQQFDYARGFIELAGTAEDYRLREYTTSEGVESAGSYLFYVGDGSPDLVAFIFPCDELAPTISGRPPENLTALCNPSRSLSLEDPNQFVFSQPRSEDVALPRARQTGTDGNEVVSGLTTDDEGNVYVFGLTDGAFVDGLPSAPNYLFVASATPAGAERWATQLPLPEGSILKAAVADEEFLYAAGRTLGALPGYENGGSWDGIIVKLRLSDGEVVDTDQFGSPGIDGYGNVTLDGRGGLFVSAQGAPDRTGGPGGTDRDYLVARHSTETLDVEWRVIESPDDRVLASAEAWGGLTYVPANTGEPERLIVGGWFFSANGADAFVAAYESLDASSPTRTAYRTIATPGQRADWVLDTAVDAVGNVYAVGYTTGELEGGDGHQGEGDAFVLKLNSELETLETLQFGTERSDLARKIEVGTDGFLYVTGYTYGSLFSDNADPSQRSADVFVLRLNADLGIEGQTQFGTPHEDRTGLALRGTSLWVGGTTEGAMGGVSAGGFDAWWAELATTELDFGTDE